MTLTSARARFRVTVFASLVLLGATGATAAPIVLDAAGAQTLNNLRQLALAALNYEATFTRFPNDYVDGATPILSWRVALLPYLGENALFTQFDTTKAWNDPVNLPLLSQMPDVFRSPASANGSTDTDYAGAVGTGTMFEGGLGPTLLSVTDGTSNTILFGEALGSAIPWTQPGDISVGSCPTLGGSGFSSFLGGPVPFAFVDGSVGLLSDTISCNALRALLGRNDQAIVNRDDLLLPFVVPEPPIVLLMIAVTIVVWQRRA